MDYLTCDRCGPNVRAKVAVKMDSGLDLYFCLHHARVLDLIHHPSVVMVGMIYDKTRVQPVLV